MIKKRNKFSFGKILLITLLVIILIVCFGFYFKGITGNVALANYLDTVYAPPYKISDSADYFFKISDSPLVAVEDVVNLSVNVSIDGYIYQKGYVFNQLTKNWEVFNFNQTPVENSYWIKDFASADLEINVSNRIVDNSETYIVAYACQKDSNGKWQCGCRSAEETECKRWMLHKLEIINISNSLEVSCTENANCSMTGGTCDTGRGVCVSRSKIAFSGSGSGTFEDPYQITTWAQLNEVRNNLDASYILMNNLDENSVNYSDYASLSANSGKGWEPIGNCGPNSECWFWNYDYTFRGSLNGKRYSINNLNINNFEGQNLGLFGYIYSSNISNLNIDGELMGSSYVGGIAGFMDSSLIVNSSSSVNINEGFGSFQFGGIAGYVYGYSSIINSSSSATITGGANSHYLGGIAGYVYDYSSIINSSSSATIIGGDNSDHLGGICARLGSSSIINSSSSATITGGANSLYLGGVAGDISFSSSIINSSSSATIIGGDNSNYSGGIAGSVYSSSIINSSSSATITGGVGSSYLGGISGQDSSSSSIINSSSSATITGGANSHYLGGIAGYDHDASIINSSSSATITGGVGSSYLGGIVGYGSMYTKITNSYVSISDSQTLSGTSNLGLIAGSFSGTITKTFGIVYDLQFGNITFSNWNVGLSGGGDLINLIYLNNNYASIGMTAPSANITLYGITSGNQINKNGAACGSACYNFTPLNAGTVKFSVTGAGNYTVV